MFHFKKEKKFFKSFQMNFLFKDGSKVKSDPLSFDDFKKIVKNRIKGEEFRKPTELDYQEIFNEMKYYAENPDECEYFSVSINGKSFDFNSKDIVKIKTIIQE